jgi:hypothetical protein
MNRRSSNLRLGVAVLLLVAGTLCGELAGGVLSRVVAPALLVLGVAALVSAYLTFTSSQPAGGAESTKRVASSR